METGTPTVQINSRNSALSLSIPSAKGKRVKRDKSTTAADSLQKHSTATRLPTTFEPTINAMAKARAVFVWLIIKTSGARRPSDANRKTKPISMETSCIARSSQRPYPQPSQAQTCSFPNII